MSKPKVALYWASSCGGCEIGVLDIGDKLLALIESVDIVFWPVAIDIKYDDVRAMEDKEIDLCLFNGAIRTSENEEIAKLLRQKSKVMVAFGSCAVGGGIPGLANVNKRQDILDNVYIDNPSIDNSERVFPQTELDVPEGKLELPEFYENVYTLDQLVDVEYYVPGCPPVADQIWAVLTAVLEGALPEVGSTVGAGQKIVCDECPLEKEETLISKFVRPHEIIPEPGKCLLEQGIYCAGIATRSGCEACCPTVGMPCRGCYGVPDKVFDQGAKIVSALGSILDTEDPEEAKKIMNQIPNPIGTFYRFGLPGSLLRRRTDNDN